MYPYNARKLEIEFYKYNGTGNDFILIDNRSSQRIFTTDQIAFLCHRNFGIGADGLILLQDHSDYDFKMIYFNSDGNESTMCGNGGRCIVQFAYDLGIIKNETIFIAIDGPHKAKVLADKVSIQMINVSEIRSSDSYTILDTGSPHYVAFMNHLPSDDFLGLARNIRNSPPFKAEGINVNFAKLDHNNITMRTFERGVENETLACGTGATAVAIAAHSNGLTDEKNISLTVLGGQLEVSFESDQDKYRNIWLTGPALKVFNGKIDLNV